MNGKWTQLIVCAVSFGIQSCGTKIKYMRIWNCEMHKVGEDQVCETF